MKPQVVKSLSAPLVMKYALVEVGIKGGGVRNEDFGSCMDVGHGYHIGEKELEGRRPGLEGPVGAGSTGRWGMWAVAAVAYAPNLEILTSKLESITGITGQEDCG